MQERKKNPSAFLRNIFQILQNVDLNSIIEWAPNGNGFVIKNLADFESQILPQYFKHKKYSSFVRQLNMYGFHKQRNSMFENCFLHAQFRRGEELPTDIKRKPEKKKKAEQNEGEKVEKESNWLCFSKELRQFFPQIADNILVKNEQNKHKHIILRDHKNSQDYQASSQPMEDLQEEEEYVSKISLRGLFDDMEQNPESTIKNESNPNYQRQQWVKNEQSIENEPLNESIKDECESDANESYEKDGHSVVVIQQASSIKYENVFNENIKQQEKQAKYTQFQAASFSFHEGTMDSFSGLSEVLIRQNQILRKTHPIIRKMLLTSQQNKINYLKTQIQAEDHVQNEEVPYNTMNVDSILEVEKDRLEELIDFLQREVEGLKEQLMDEEIPFSNTSIRFRLERHT